MHSDGRRLVLLGAAQGLVSEADAVEDQLRRLRPAAVGIQVDPDNASGADEWPVVEPDAPEDWAYIRGLSVFGDVELPAPDLRRAAAVAKELGATLTGIDVDEMDWTEEFTRRVSGLALVRRGLRVRGRRRRTIKAESPEAYCDAWDAAFNRPPFAQLEAWREHGMAARATALCRDGGPAVVIVDAARFPGVLQALEGSGFRVAPA